MATASGKTEGRPRSAGRRSVGSFVAYGVVLALLGLAGFIVWTNGGRDRPGLAGGVPAPAAPMAAVATFDPRTAPGLKLPPLPVAQESAEPDKADSHKAEPQPVTPEATVKEVSPPQSETEKRAEPPASACKVDPGRWPTERSDQAKAIQVLLRDLGFYRGTTNGTAGPITRAAIREFQLAAGEAETGEVTEALFDALKKKCATP